MQHTVSAVFTNFAEAQLARDELLRSGFSEDDVTLDQETAGEQYPQEDSISGREKEGGITGFFHRLFGTEDDLGEFEPHSMATRHKNIVLTVDASDDILMERATEVIDRHHPLNVEDHASPSQVAESAQHPLSFDEAGGDALDAGSDDPLLQAQRDAALGGEESAGDIPQANPARYSDSDFRSHWQGNFSQFGGRYEDYSPAYLYGVGLNDGGRFAGREWADIENMARAGWEQQYPQAQYPESGWERVKEAVRHGWEKATR